MKLALKNRREAQKESKGHTAAANEEEPEEETKDVRKITA